MVYYPSSFSNALSDNLIPGNMRSSIKNSKMVRLPFPHEVIILLNLIAGKLEKYCYSSQKSKFSNLEPYWVTSEKKGKEVEKERSVELSLLF